MFVFVTLLVKFLLAYLDLLVLESLMRYGTETMIVIARLGVPSRRGSS